jgi:hypothetical protein
MKQLFAILPLLLAPTALLAATDGSGQDPARDTAQPDTDRDAAVIAAQKPSYPLTSCVVSGEPLGSMGDPIDLVVEGRLYRLCCKGCVKKVQADPAPFAEKVIAAVIADQKPRYPLETCVVTDEALEGGHMEPADHVIGTRLVRFCCAGCTKGFEASPETFMPKLDEAWMAAQRPSYPLDTCIVSGQPLEDARELLYGVTLVRLCCKKCERAFQAEPEPFLQKLADARAKAEEERGG